METFGAVASAIALSATLLKSCRFLKELCDSMKDAPKEVKRLFQVLKRLQQIVAEMQRLGQSPDFIWDDSHLTENWKDQIHEISTDIATVATILEKLQKSLDSPSLLDKKLSGRIRKFWNENELEHHEQVLVRHQDTFTLVLGIINELSDRTNTRRLQMPCWRDLRGRTNTRY